MIGTEVDLGIEFMLNPGNKEVKLIYIMLCQHIKHLKEFLSKIYSLMHMENNAKHYRQLKILSLYNLI